MRRGRENRSKTETQTERQTKSLGETDRDIQRQRDR